MFKFYTHDDLDAVAAKFEAQKIAFAPLTFQAARAMRDLGILEIVSKSRKTGVSAKEVSEKSGISEYGANVLLEMGLGMGIFKIKDDSPEDAFRYTLGKVGFFLLTDDMTRVNMDFSEDVCYAAADDLKDSIRTGKPEGLKRFGPWKTVYEGLSKCSGQFQKSWFGFDHFYSDQAFPEALPIVFSRPVKKLFDIGGNTAKWAIACCRYNPEVSCSIVDLPGQTAVADKNVKAANLESRISTVPCDILDESSTLPTGADAVWMSQFLDCFSLPQVTGILEKVHATIDEKCDVYVLEPLWDEQRFEAAAYSLQATSLYFTCVANGNSKMYRFAELKDAIEAGGFELREAHHNLGVNSYSLLRFGKK